MAWYEIPEDDLVRCGWLNDLTRERFWRRRKTLGGINVYGEYGIDALAFDPETGIYHLIQIKHRRRIDGNDLGTFTHTVHWAIKMNQGYQGVVYYSGTISPLTEAVLGQDYNTTSIHLDFEERTAASSVDGAAASADDESSQGSAAVKLYPFQAEAVRKIHAWLPRDDGEPSEYGQNLRDYDSDDDAGDDDNVGASAASMVPRNMTLLDLPPGCGKTQIFIEVIRNLPRDATVIVMSPTRALNLQTAARFKETGVSVTIIDSNHERNDVLDGATGV